MLVKWKKFQKIHSKVTQKELQMSIIKKYLKDNIYFHKKTQEIVDKIRLKWEYYNRISKMHNKIIQRIIKKYLKKDIYFSKKDKQLLII